MSILWVGPWLVYWWLSGIDPGCGGDVSSPEEIVVDSEGGIGDFAGRDLLFGIVRVSFGFLWIGTVKTELLSKGISDNGMFFKIEIDNLFAGKKWLISVSSDPDLLAGG